MRTFVLVYLFYISPVAILGDDHRRKTYVTLISNRKTNGIKRDGELCRCADYDGDCYELKLQIASSKVVCIESASDLLYQRPIKCLLLSIIICLRVLIIVKSILWGLKLSLRRFLSKLGVVCFFP